jgi:hypothetical protein
MNPPTGMLILKKRAFPERVPANVPTAVVAPIQFIVPVTFFVPLAGSSV